MDPPKRDSEGIINPIYFTIPYNTFSRSFQIVVFAESSDNGARLLMAQIISLSI